MYMHCPNNVERGMQTDLTLLYYALAIMKQKRVWEFFAQKFDRFRTLSNKQHPASYKNTQQGVQMDTTCNIQQCCVCLHRALKKKISTLGLLK